MTEEQAFKIAKNIGIHLGRVALYVGSKQQSEEYRGVIRLAMQSDVLFSDRGFKRPWCLPVLQLVSDSATDSDRHSATECRRTRGVKQADLPCRAGRARD